jgi:hypothetical protein
MLTTHRAQMLGVSHHRMVEDRWPTSGIEKHGSHLQAQIDLVLDSGQRFEDSFIG